MDGHIKDRCIAFIAVLCFPAGLGFCFPVGAGLVLVRTFRDLCYSYQAHFEVC